MSVVEAPPPVVQPPARKSERPLPPPVLLSLGLGLAGITALANLYCLLAILVIGCMIVIDGALFLGGLRFGFWSYGLNGIIAQGRLGRLLLRGLRPEHGVDWELPLQRADAPELFRLIEQVAARVGVPPPDDVRLVMEMNAWVRLRGVRKGRGHTVLGIGFDMLTLLSRAELEAVLAHEMAHAKLVQRGYKGWAVRAMNRLGQLDQAAGALYRAYRDAKRSFLTAKWLSAGMDALGRTGMRMLAAYCRQDEFAADRAAAEQCGAAIYRQTLIRIEEAAVLSAELSWRDRLISSQKEPSFTAWLQTHLAPRDDAHRAELAAKAREYGAKRKHEYDTHPELVDRLAALPADERPAPPAGPALALLADPDATADRLIAEVERLAVEEEGKESGELLAGLRRGGWRFTAIQWLGAALLLLTLALLASAALIPNADAETRIGLLFGVAGAAVSGILLLKQGGRQTEPELAAPPLGSWEAALKERPKDEERRDWRLRAEAEAARLPLPPGATSRRDRAAFWRARILTCLGACDYAGAWGAYVQAAALQPGSVECKLAYALVQAYILDFQMLKVAMNVATSSRALGASTSWGLGWAMAMAGNWPQAEAYLHDAAQRREGEATIWAVLGLCQWRRQKLREAARSMRRAADLDPTEPRIRLHLARVLLDLGRPREADDLLRAPDLAGRAADDYDTLVARTRAALLLGRAEEAEGLAAALTAAHPAGKALLALARAYRDVDDMARANDYLERAAACGYYPEAYVGQAMMLLEKKEVPERARALLLQALDVTREPDDGGASVLSLLETICRGLAELRPEVAGCEGWVAKVDMSRSPAHARSLSLLVYAGDGITAGAYVKELYDAMHPGPPMPEPPIQWQQTPREDWPDRPISPGVYGVRAS